MPVLPTRRGMVVELVDDASLDIDAWRQRTQARRALDHCLIMLDERGTKPSPETLDLARQLRQSPTAPA
jgi:hypothetical protein